MRVSNNIAFRATTLNPEEKQHKYYQADIKTAPNIMKGLKKAGEESKYYQHLRRAFTAQSVVDSNASKEFKTEKPVSSNMNKTVLSEAKRSSSFAKSAAVVFPVPSKKKNQARNDNEGDLIFKLEI